MDPKDPQFNQSEADLATIKGIAQATRDKEVDAQKAKFTPEMKANFDKMGWKEPDWESQRKRPLFPSFDVSKQRDDAAKEWVQEKFGDWIAHPESKKYVIDSKFNDIIRHNYPDEKK